MRRFKITGKDVAAGAAFEVDDDATEEQIAEAACECVLEYISYGWEEVTDDDD
jgi:hypothetical protein